MSAIFLTFKKNQILYFYIYLRIDNNNSYLGSKHITEFYSWKYRKYQEFFLKIMLKSLGNTFQIRSKHDMIFMNRKISFISGCLHRLPVISWMMSFKIFLFVMKKFKYFKKWRQKFEIYIKNFLWTMYLSIYDFSFQLESIFSNRRNLNFFSICFDTSSKWL